MKRKRNIVRFVRMNADVIGALVVLSIFISAIVALFVVAPIIQNSNERTVVATVTDKEVKNDVYLVYTSETTYEIEDSIIKKRFNSSDVYGAIEIGETYEFTICGVRSGFWSMYPNILDFKECENENNV